MFKFLSLGKSVPTVDSSVLSDEIIPLHWFEDGFMWKKVIVYTLFMFDDALDPEKLRDALKRLIQRDGYKKLGGRLRKNAQGGLDYHVPAEFTSSRPAVAYTHTHHDVKAADHAVASKIPKPVNLNSPAVVGNPEELSELCRGATNKVLSIDDYLTTDRPTLGLNVTTFQDITCVSLYWPHVAFDAMGKKAIIEGWTLMLQGREDEIPTPIGYDTDLLTEFGKNATEPHLLGNRRMGNLGMAGYALRNIRGLVGPKEIRMVCIPALFWEEMVAKVREELARDAADGEEPFVTEGDVLVAWWTRICCSHLDKSPNMTVAAQNSMSLHKVLGNDLLSPSNRPFISIALGFPTVLLPAGDILNKPLSWLALQFRHAINEQGTRKQVEAYAALQREFSPTMRMPIFFGDNGMYNLFYSNWQKAGLFNFDFGTASVSGRGALPLRASYIQCVQDPAFPEGWPISGKDGKGNYWISGFREPWLWQKIESELKKQASQVKA